MQIIRLDSIDSTNSEAIRRLSELDGGSVLTAREQTGGRGQRGNTWFSEPGENLTFSIVLKFGDGALPPLKVSQAQFINYLTSVVAANFVSRFAIEPTIKWPNDIYVGKNKIAGILIENRLDNDNLAASVIGIGININQREFPNLVNATSLFRCRGERYDLDECLQKFLEIFESYLPCIFNEDDRKWLFSKYAYQLYGSKYNTRFHDNLTGIEYWGKVEGVEGDGRIRIHNLETHERLKYNFKEVSYVL